MHRREFFPVQNILCSAISAIDIALWDIKDKALNQPAYNLIGGLTRDKVVCYPHTTGNSLDELLELPIVTPIVSKINLLAKLTTLRGRSSYSL